jgi:PIN domain nuclease of toxin-antitoxin system
MRFLTDTHALLWWFIDSPKLSPKAFEIFTGCEKGEKVIFIPSIVVAEALSIFDKKRISFDFKRLFKKIHESENFMIVSLDYHILLKMVDLKDVFELHDKIIVATAKYLNLPIITKDRVLQNLSSINTIW